MQEAHAVCVMHISKNPSRITVLKEWVIITHHGA